MNIENATELKVGALVSAVLGLIIFMSFQMTEDPSFLSHKKHYWFYVPDASGLIENSAIKMAGIDVGIIEEIELKQGLGYIKISVKGDIRLSSNSKVEIRANGILGDKYVEVIQGDLGGLALKDGGQIKDVRDVGSLSSVMNEVGKIANSLGSVAQVIEDAATKNDNRDSPIARIINNLEVFTQDLAEISNSRKRKIGEIVDDLHTVTTQLGDVFNDPSDRGFQAMWTRLSNTAEKLDQSMDNFNEITAKINSGEGSLGKLVHDESTVENVNETLVQVGEFFGQTSKLTTDIDFHSSYLMKQDETKNHLTLKIQPGLDRYYEVGIVDDPFGISETTDTAVSSPPGSGDTVTRTTTTFKDKVKFNALIAKNFFNLTIKAGIIESSGGVGLEYLLYKKYLKLKLDAFDFEETNLRSSLQWSFYKGIYVHGGVEDILDKQVGTSGYLGAGIYLTNDDLKLLLSGLSL